MFVRHHEFAWRAKNILNAPKSKSGVVIAGLYLVLVAVVCTPLILDQAIHHGNGIAFLGAVILTLPLSWPLLRLLDKVAPANAFYMTGGHYYLTMSVLAICAIFNAVALYHLIKCLTYLRTKYLTKRKS